MTPERSKFALHAFFKFLWHPRGTTNQSVARAPASILGAREILPGNGGTDRVRALVPTASHGGPVRAQRVGHTFFPGFSWVFDLCVLFCFHKNLSVMMSYVLIGPSFQLSVFSRGGDPHVDGAPPHIRLSALFFGAAILKKALSPGVDAQSPRAGTRGKRTAISVPSTRRVLRSTANGPRTRRTPGWRQPPTGRSMTTVELSSGFSPTFHPRSLPFSGDREDSGPRAEAASAPSHAHQGRATRAEMIRRDASSSTSVEDDARVDTAALASRVSSGAEGASNRRGSSPLGKTARTSLHRQGIQRVKSTPELGVHATGPAPGSKEMRDMFFVRQDAVNFNASYGTPVREVRGGIVGNLFRRTWMRLFFWRGRTWKFVSRGFG